LHGINEVGRSCIRIVGEKVQQDDTAAQKNDDGKWGKRVAPAVVSELMTAMARVLPSAVMADFAISTCALEPKETMVTKSLSFRTCASSAKVGKKSNGEAGRGKEAPR
jgi:hypothetical protein